jgi:hypothetical protein
MGRWICKLSGRKSKIGGGKSSASDIRSLQRAGISTASAEELLARMLAKVDERAAERDRILGKQRLKYPGTDKFIRGAKAR